MIYFQMKMLEKKGGGPAIHLFHVSLNLFLPVNDDSCSQKKE
jgi:hypothetical protein